MGYGELELCNDFNRLSAVFDDSMLKYFQKQLADYLNGSDNHPEVVCWWEGIIDTEEFIKVYL